MDWPDIARDWRTRGSRAEVSQVTNWTDRIWWGIRRHTYRYPFVPTGGWSPMSRLPTFVLEDPSVHHAQIGAHQMC